MSASAEDHELACRVCGAASTVLGVVHGSYSGRDYRLARCSGCGYAFIVDPWLDYAAIYDDRYYSGRGADPLVDYEFELAHPDRTIRRYEWRGVARIVGDLMDGERRPLRWLDYGCGNGALVRYLRDQSIESVGYEQGSIAGRARALGVPILDPEQLEQAARQEPFDVVTAIEVLEHTRDPVLELRRMRRLLRPGGLLFLTTGNARPYVDALPQWRYVRPEIHISFFEPRTLEYALAASGFRPERRDLGRGFDEVMKFKVLKNLRVRRRSPLTDAMPAGVIGRLGDRVARLSEHPFGWASSGPTDGVSGDTRQLGRVGAPGG